jgi:hypothetical protein
MAEMSVERDSRGNRGVMWVLEGNKRVFLRNVGAKLSQINVAENSETCDFVKVGG